jgi:predicted molibdopterin-dependent oxidoreductase YjgC
LAEPKGLQRGSQVQLTVDGTPCQAYLGETVAVALMARDDLELRSTGSGAARGLFCGMGVCFDCLVIVDGVPSTRACVTWVADGMVVDRQRGPGEPYRDRDSPGPRDPSRGPVHPT